jgi:hypothetical protein
VSLSIGPSLAPYRLPGIFPRALRGAAQQKWPPPVGVHQAREER